MVYSKTTVPISKNIEIWWNLAYFEILFSIFLINLFTTYYFTYLLFILQKFNRNLKLCIKVNFSVDIIFLTSILYCFITLCSLKYHCKILISYHEYTCGSDTSIQYLVRCCWISQLVLNLLQAFPDLQHIEIFSLLK